MTISSRIRQHIRGNVVGYIALFAALGGTAAALPGRNSVDANDIAKKAVKSRALANKAVKGRAIAPGAVKNGKLADGAVSATKLQDGAVVQTKLGDAAVTNEKLANDSVTRQKIVQGTINGGKLANGAVTSQKVRDGDLLAADFAPGQLADGFLINSPVGQGQFETQRAGRALVIATLRTDCNPGATCTFGVTVNGVQAQGGSADAGDGEHITLIGLAPIDGPGVQDVNVTETGPGGGILANSVRIGVILLQ